jgi:hypothetical protein
VENADCLGEVEPVPWSGDEHDAIQTTGQELNENLIARIHNFTHP